MRRRRAQGAALLIAGLLVVGGCGGDSLTVAAGAGAADPPSQSAKMVCAPEAQLDIANALGSRPTRAVTATWVDHVYSCHYLYRDAQIVLSVKELADDNTTTGYFDSLAQRLGKRGAVGGLGHDAFDALDDSVVVRKDFEVLDVDVSGLPGRFGNPPIARSQAAMRVALVVMGCWTGP